MNAFCFPSWDHHGQGFTLCSAGTVSSQHRLDTDRSPIHCTEALSLKKNVFVLPGEMKLLL
jgi:hypothetical protein